LDHPAPGWGIIGPVPGRQSPFVRFGPFEANLAARELHKDGVRLKLQDQPFRLLEALLEKPGEVVTREELQQRIWGEDTYVDFDKSLSAAVNKVRQALGDSRTRPRYIETIPKVGYRFIGEIGSEISPASEQPPEREPHRGPSFVWAAGLALLAALAWLGFLAWNGSSGGSSDPTIASLPVQLTSYPGEERQPAFSPDGNQVVFTRREQGRQDYDIWVKFIGEEKALQLTSSPADEMSPAWSPNGSQIAFLRHKPGGLADVVLISPHGDAERTLREIHSRAPYTMSTLDWSPDGSRLLTSQRFDSGGETGLFAIAVDSSVMERLLDLNVRTPSYSPDGETIAFLLGTSQPELALMPSKGGQVHKLGYSIRNPGRSPIPWTADGLGLIEVQPLSIYPLSGGAPVPLPAVGGSAIEPAVSTAAGRLTYSASTFLNTTIWLLNVQAPGTLPREFAPTSLGNSNPQFSHDGRQVVFTSSRSGELAIWVANVDGTNLRRLTDIPVGGSPRWSPNASEVVFDGPNEGEAEIYAVASFGGTPHRITNNPKNDSVPSYSSDGRWIYFAANRSGEWQTWRVSVEGEERRPDSVRQMTQGGGYAAFESSDGRYLYYAKKRLLGAVGERNSLWRIPVEGGAEEVVIEGLYSGYSSWALAGDSVFFLNPQDQSEDPDTSSWAIYKIDLKTHKQISIAPIEGRPWGGPSFDVSHDERWIPYSTIDPPESDLMLVEGFQ
jgi:Tol biopolymer transport system component/DNA-binding winged helix-turn-helix (wHTH) protein